MRKRYVKNTLTLSVEENDRLANFNVCVVGCGGIGGYVIEMLGRLGVGHITAVDGDHFEESNLNRQLLSDTESLGMQKAIKAKERMEKVNPLICLEAVTERLSQQNGKELLQGADVAVDSLDNIETRLMLEKLCAELNIPLVHGAIAGWYGQVATILPGDGVLARFYEGKTFQGMENKLGNPSFTPALVASIEVAEVVKLLIGRGKLLRKKMLFFDLLELNFQLIEL